MPHLLRRWQERYATDPDRLCLTYNQTNAHNVVDRHSFLVRMQEVAPGTSRWLEYIYPTDTPAKVFYRDVVIDSASGGQQGCPLMTACHATVHRLLLESLGLAEPPAGTLVTLPRLEPAARLDIAPCFADDGVLAGAATEVLRALRHLRAVMPQTALQFSSLQVVAAAGPTTASTSTHSWLRAAALMGTVTLRCSSHPSGATPFARPTARQLLTNSGQPSTLLLPCRTHRLCTTCSDTLATLPA